MNQQGGIIVKHTTDKMKAFVALAKDSVPMSVSTVLTELLRGGIAHGLNTAAIQKFAAAGQCDKYVEVACGTPVRPGTDGWIENLVEASAEQRRVEGPNGLSFMMPRAFIAVEAGAPLARRIPATAGVDGMDVFGAALPAPPVKDAELLAGEGVITAPGDPDLLIAEQAGTLYKDPDGKIEVRPYLDIPGDVDNAGVGAISFKGDLKVGGSVASGTRVEVSGALVIMGGVEEAEVVCGGDLTISGAVSGGGKGMIECGGCARLNSIENAAVVVERDLIVEGNAVESDINCKGALKARSIIGGCASASGGICAVTIGGAAGTPTVVDIGAGHVYLKKRESVKYSLGAQNDLVEECVSRLYCFVRDNMDEFGLILDEKVKDADEMVKMLKDALTASAELEKDLNDIDELLNAIENCCISAKEVYPGVQFKLGFSEQRVKEMLKDIMLRPGIVKVKEE